MKFKAEIRKVADLIPHPRNQEFFDHIHGDMWDLLVESITKDGLKDPILITTNNIVVSGNERLRVHKFKHIEEIECIVREYKNEDEILKDLIEINIIQRGDGNPNLVKLGHCILELERIYGINYGNNQYNKSSSPLENSMTQQELMRRLNKDRNTYARSKMLAELPKEYQDLIEGGSITPSTGARFIATLSEEDQMKLLEQLPATKKYTQKQVQELYDDMKLQLEQKDNEIIILEQKNSTLANSDVAYMEKQEELERTQAELRKVYERAEQQVDIISKMKKEADESKIAAELVKSNYKLIESISMALANQVRDIGSIAKYMKQEDKEKYQKLLNKIEGDIINAIDDIKHNKSGNKILSIK